MAYESIDALQNAMADVFFHDREAKKKAAGRALGTIVELITFYLLKEWGFEKCTAIESPLPEYGNISITHNVEFSMHPSTAVGSILFKGSNLPLSARKIFKELQSKNISISGKIKNDQLVSSSNILKNSCCICEDTPNFYNAYITRDGDDRIVDVVILENHPYAVVECKRVGVEEGNKKGPQTIEKAKQGSYVAKALSSMQKIRMSDGSIYGAVQKDDASGFHIKDYQTMLDDILNNDIEPLPSGFTLTIGVVSNHGNWFTSDNPNKEIKILSQSYDVLLFLTDQGLSDFVDKLLINPSEEYLAVQSAFRNSYNSNIRGNVFTKSRIEDDADKALQTFFHNNIEDVMRWFNVISPSEKQIDYVKAVLSSLTIKANRI